MRKNDYMSTISPNKPAFYGVKIDEKGNPGKNISPSVKIIEVVTNEKGIPSVTYNMLYDNSCKKPGVTIQKTFFEQKREYKDFYSTIEMFKREGYRTISKKDYDEICNRNNACIKVINDNIDFVKGIYAGLGIGKEPTKSPKPPIKKSSYIDYIEEKSNTDISFRYLKDLFSKYKDDFSITEIFYAATGHGSIQEDYLKQGFVFTEDMHKNACDALDYLLKFKDIADKVPGRKSFLNMVILACYNCKSINNDELYKRLHKKYGKLKIEKIQSVDNAIDEVEKYYNYLQSKKNKVNLHYVLAYMRS